MGFELSLAVPETVEENDQLAKRVGATLESAVANVIYRAVLPEFRANFAEAVENNTGIARLTEEVLDKAGQTKKDDEGEPITRYTETEQKYFDRVTAILVSDGKFESVEAAAASFYDLAKSVIGAITYNPAAAERTSSGPKKVAKQYLKLAQDWSDSDKLEAAVAKLSEKLGSTWKIEATVDSVARAVAEDQRRKREAAKLQDEYSV